MSFDLGISEVERTLEGHIELVLEVGVDSCRVRAARHSCLWLNPRYKVHCKKGDCVAGKASFEHGGDL